MMIDLTMNYDLKRIKDQIRQVNYLMQRIELSNNVNYKQIDDLIKKYVNENDELFASLIEYFDDESEVSPLKLYLRKLDNLKSALAESYLKLSGDFDNYLSLLHGIDL